MNLSRMCSASSSSSSTAGRSESPRTGNRPSSGRASICRSHAGTFGTRSLTGISGRRRSSSGPPRRGRLSTNPRGRAAVGVWTGRGRGPMRVFRRTLARTTMIMVSADFLHFVFLFHLTEIQSESLELLEMKNLNNESKKLNRTNALGESMKVQCCKLINKFEQWVYVKIML